MDIGNQNVSNEYTLTHLYGNCKDLHVASRSTGGTSVPETSCICNSQCSFYAFYACIWPPPRPPRARGSGGRARIF
eukprot:COSAG05_NODE_3_length_51333_cov_129.132080_23_plen_76_part_00